MKLVYLIMLSLFTISMTSNAQDTKRTIEKLARDPKTAENAAKADVYIVDSKKVISDTLVKTEPKAGQRRKVRKKR